MVTIVAECEQSHTAQLAVMMSEKFEKNAGSSTTG